MPARAAMSSEAAKNASISDDIDGRIDEITVVHHDDSRLVFGDYPRHVGVALQAPDVVGDRGAGAERPCDHGGFHAVDGDRHAQGHHGAKHRLQPLQLFLGGNRLRAVGPGGLRADVDDVGALGDHAPGLGQRTLRRHKLPTVGKGIRRYIEHTHTTDGPRQQRGQHRMILPYGV